MDIGIASESIWKIFNISLMVFSVPAFLVIVYISRKKDKFVVIGKDQVVGVVKRSIAYLIDAVICLNLGYLIYKLFGILSVNFSYSIFGSLFVFTLWLYFSLLESSRLQGTLGKYSLGMKIVKVDGTRISFATSTVRLILCLLFEIVLPLVNFVIFFTKYNQCAHDVLTNTVTTSNKEVRGHVSTQNTTLQSST